MTGAFMTGDILSPSCKMFNYLVRCKTSWLTTVISRDRCLNVGLAAADSGQNHPYGRRLLLSRVETSDEHRWVTDELRWLVLACITLHFVSNSSKRFEVREYRLIDLDRIFVHLAW